MADRIRLRRDTAANWASVNPILLLAEAGWETDTGKIKLGDGVNAWNDLDYSAKPITWKGVYSASVAYKVLDAVYYNSQSYICKSATTAGTLPTNTTNWDLLAAKGADGTNGTDGANGASIVWRDAYSNTITYAQLDVVSYLGTSYICKVSSSLGVLPTNTTNWSLVASKGDTGPAGAIGPSGASIVWRGAYSSAIAYEAFDAVSSSGSSYVCILAHTNQPVTDTTYWALLAQKGDTGSTGATGAAGQDGANGQKGDNGASIIWKGEYSDTTEYVVLDAVSYNGQSYICKAATTGSLPTDTTKWDLMAAKGDVGTITTVAGTTSTVFTATADGQVQFSPINGYTTTNVDAYSVSVGGVDQRPTVDYTISSANNGKLVLASGSEVKIGTTVIVRAYKTASGGGDGGSGTVTSITAGTGLDGGTITDSGTISLASITTAQSNVGSSTAIPVLSINDQGQVTALSTAAFVALTTAQIAGLSTTAPAALSTTAIAGLSSFAARADHAHSLPSAADVGALGATAAAGGDLAGNYPNPTLAAVTTAQSNIGSSSVVPVLSVDAKGRVTSLTTAAIQAVSTTAITSLTGDVTAAGPGAAAATLAAITTAQSNVGSSTEIPVLSIDAKGRVTALSTAAIVSVYSVEYLLVAGGGSGGSAGGGGAGGVLSGTINVQSGSVYPIVIGAGGASGTGTNFLGNSGSNSTALNNTAIGGGGGGRWSGSTNNQNGVSGGSGGGAGLNNVGALNAGGAGTSGQGFAGGNANQLASTGLAAAGGGGAAALGGDKVNAAAGAGGAGVLNAINGTSLYWGGGGGGGSQISPTTPGNGGIGGGGGGANGNGGTNTSTGGGSALNAGGNGTTAGSGAGGTGGSGGANTGGGGGGMAISVGTAGAGGSGIFILRYLGNQRGTGGTVTSSGGYTIHTFLSSGNFTA